MDDEKYEAGCICPVCGQEIGPEDIDVDEYPGLEYIGIAHAECPRCGHVSSWLN